MEGIQTLVDCAHMKEHCLPVARLKVVQEPSKTSKDQIQNEGSGIVPNVEKSPHLLEEWWWEKEREWLRNANTGDNDVSREH